MYLRRHTKKHSGELYEYWTLVESVRTARGPRQRTVACLGKLSNEERPQAKGWSDLDSLLSDDEPEQLSRHHQKRALLSHPHFGHRLM